MKCDKIKLIVVIHSLSDYTEMVINQMRLIYAVEKEGRLFAATCLKQRTGILVAGKLVSTMLLGTCLCFTVAQDFPQVQVRVMVSLTLAK